MKPMTFDEHWQTTWQSTGQPAIFDAAMREIALKAWNAAVQASAVLLEMKPQEIRLAAGEMTAGEMRTTQAVLTGRASAVRRLNTK